MDSPTPGFTFGMRLGDVREGQGLTKSAMAKSLGIAPSTWSSYENDMTFPSQDTIDLFCKLYNVNMGWLMTNEGPEYVDASEQAVANERSEILDMLSEGAPSREAAEDLLNKVMGLDPDVLKTALRAIALNNRNKDK